jgi:hypothetical protein
MYDAMMICGEKEALTFPAAKMERIESMFAVLTL